MKSEYPMATGDEYDALTRWRRFVRWRAGQRASIKRGFRRRVRRLVKRMIDRSTPEGDR